MKKYGVATLISIILVFGLTNFAEAEKLGYLLKVDASSFLEQSGYGKIVVVRGTKTLSGGRYIINAVGFDASTTEYYDIEMSCPQGYDGMWSLNSIQKR